MMRSPSPWSCSSPEQIKPEPTTPDSSPPESNYISDYPLCSPISDSKEFDPEPVIAILPPLSGPLSPATVIQSHYRQRLDQLLGQLATALSSLPPLVPAGAPNCLGFDGFASLAAKPARREFGQLRAVLGQVWGVPGGVRIEHITRGQQGTTLVLNLIERVGADALSRLDDDEREEAVAWVRSLRDAATERSRYASVEASQPLFEEDSPPADAHLAIAPEQTWDEPSLIFSSKPYSSLYDLSTYDNPTSAYDDDDDAASVASYASSTSSTSSAGFRSPRVSRAPRHLHHPTRDDRPPAPKRIKLIGAHVGSLPQVKRLSNNPSGMPRSASAPSLGAKPNPPTARVASRQATKAAATPATATPKPSVPRAPAVPRSVPTPPVAMPILPQRPSLSGRAQRVRKMPVWLSDAAELPAAPTTPPAVAEPKPAPAAVAVTQPQAQARERERRAARNRGEEEPEVEDETRFKPETAVLARQPFGWWPSVVLNPKDAPPETVGTWEPKAYLIKSIPTGGDWRWLPPHLVEPFPLELCRQLLADELPNESRFKAKSWRESRGDLEDAARIISDPMRLQKWLGRKTAAERGLASGKGRK